MKLEPRTRSMWRSFVSNNYIRSYYAELVQQSPSLAAVEGEIRREAIAAIGDYWVARAKTVRLYEFIILPYYIAWYIIVVITVNRYVIIIGVLPIIAALIAFYIKVNRSNTEVLAASRFLRIIVILEHNPNRWRSSEFRWDIAQRLELAAKAVERIPLGLKSVAPGIKRQIVESSRMKAQAIRELQLWAIRPNRSTMLTDLIRRLSEDMITITDGRWYELPEPDQPGHYSSRWTRIAAISGSIIIAAGGIAVLVFSAKVGPSAAFLAPLLFAGSLALLSAGGIPSAVVDRYAGMASKLSSQ